MTKCPYCGVEFDPNNSNRKYCSRSCKERAYYRRHREKNAGKRGGRPMIKQCPCCGKTFEPNKHYPHQKYCSVRCWHRQYYIDNREKCKAYYREYYAANREGLLEWARKCRRSNHD